MAFVRGNNFSNRLFGTNGNDRLEGLGGNDILEASVGNDVMVGGTGIDTANYSRLGRAMTIGRAGTVNKNGLGVDRLVGVERIIGASGFANWISGQGDSGRTSFNINLAANRLTVNGLPGIGNFTFTAVNFSNVFGTRNNDTIVGNRGRNILNGAAGNDVLNGAAGNDTLAGGLGSDRMFGGSNNDVMIGSSGNDFMSGGSGIDTADYSRLGRAMTLGRAGTVNKNGLGFDRLDGVERVIGAQGFANWISGQGDSGRTSFAVNLAANRLTVNGIPGIGNFTFTAINFANVFGTRNNDNLIGNSGRNILNGANGNDTLIGSGGNDTLVGGAGVDILNGTNSRLRGNREVDRLIGGFNPDGFVLGDRRGSYYGSAGFGDFAQITDFGSTDLIQLGVGELYRATRDAAGFNLFVLRSGRFDFIADVRTNSAISLPSGNFSLASGQTFGNFVGA
ncbi:MAG: calcium-binding protein [Cyanobacteria bacterium J06638_20]